jgi:nicotinamidase-related amidase
MRALVVIDAQNEFSAKGQRPVPNHVEAVGHISRQVELARRERRPIAWVRHYNKPAESAAFVPESWGSELSPGFGPQSGFGPEKIFEKDIFGAFSGTSIEEWLRSHDVDSVLLAGFYTHMCVSTSAREALMRGFDVAVDYRATGACDLSDEFLGTLTANEVRSSALLQLSHLGVAIEHETNARVASSSRDAA